MVPGELLTVVVVTVVVDTVLMRAQRSPSMTASTGQHVSFPQCSDKLAANLVHTPFPGAPPTMS